MEDNQSYNIKEWGKVPRNTRIELAYAIIGNAMGVLGEANAATGRVLSGEKIEERTISSYFYAAESLIRVARDLINAETYSGSGVPF